MNITGLKRSPNDHLWSKVGHRSRVVKFIIPAVKELVHWHKKKVHPCRIQLNRQLYKELKQGAELQATERDMINDKWKEIMSEFGFSLSNYQRAFAYSVVTPYRSNNGRNGERILPRPVNLKEYGAIRFDDGSGIIKDLTPEPNVRRGKIRLTLSGKGKDKKTTDVPYYIPACNIDDKQFITDSFAGNLIPRHKRNKLCYEYAARAVVEFDWLYKPEKILSFDIGKRKELYLVFNTEILWNNELTNIVPRTTELDQIITLLRNANKDIDNSDKTKEMTTKERKKERLLWENLQNAKLPQALQTYVDQIINFAIQHKCLVCLDDITTGVHNGEYGQIIGRILQRQLENKRVPFVLVPSYHTTSRCYNCGHIHKKPDYKNQTPWRPEQDKFICQECGHEAHADIQASYNIALFGWNIWLHGQHIQKDKEKNIINVGFAHRKNNNELDEVPTTMLDYSMCNDMREA